MFSFPCIGLVLIDGMLTQFPCFTPFNSFPPRTIIQLPIKWTYNQVQAHVHHISIHPGNRNPSQQHLLSLFVPNPPLVRRSSFLLISSTHPALGKLASTHPCAQVNISAIPHPAHRTLISSHFLTSPYSPFAKLKYTNTIPFLHTKCNKPQFILRTHTRKNCYSRLTHSLIW